MVQYRRRSRRRPSSMSNLDATLTALRAALDLSPDNLPLRMHLAQLLSNHGRAAEAETEYRQALALLRAALARKPADPDLYEQLADVQHALGDESAALTSLGIATALRGAPPAPPEPAAPPQPPAVASPPSPPAYRPAQPLMTTDDTVEPAPELAERPTISFADVGGMANLKERIRMAIIY